MPKTTITTTTTTTITTSETTTTETVPIEEPIEMGNINGDEDIDISDATIGLTI